MTFDGELKFRLRLPASNVSPFSHAFISAYDTEEDVGIQELEDCADIYMIRPGTSTYIRGHLVETSYQTDKDPEKFEILI